ncbi:nitroreductase [Mannheimia massilioguelmaensis]|uniref:nitroreductase n=1 Tax=Mannheimia massilioguelmaensis TaxID=1604354 RepID=UPI0005CA0965|nr:nitroreductase [Mannheimia massilioguelmaensis]
MNTIDTIHARRSVRQFDGKAIEIDTLKAIVKDAQQAPSWANSQPWKVWIATGDTLAKIKQDHLNFAYQGIRGNADFSTQSRDSWGMFARQNMQQWSQAFFGFEGQGGQHFGELQAHLYNSPAIVYLTLDKNSSAWAIYDLGGFAQTLTLSATARGIDSIAAYEVVKFPNSLRRHLGIPDNLMIAMGIALGYKSDDPLNQFVSDRVDLNEMLVIKE